MSTKSQHLQIRVTSAQKAALRRSAQRAGQGLSAYVLSCLLPRARTRFDELVRALRDDEEHRFVFAELNDLLAGLTPAEMPDAVADPPPGDLSSYLRNYVAAMVEQAAQQKSVAPPAWVREVEPLERPDFVTPLASLRLHLLRAAPVPFRRRNIFVDSGVGDRV